MRLLFVFCPNAGAPRMIPQADSVYGDPRDHLQKSPRWRGRHYLAGRSVRIVVQRVSRASVTVDGHVVGAIDTPGLCLLVGVTHDDSQADVDRLADKVWGLRILRDERSASEVDAPILVVSQFTLYADVRKGRRPSWSAAAPGSVSEPLVDAFVTALRARGATVATGRFGADMSVELVNDGPVTLVLDSAVWAR